MFNRGCRTDSEKEYLHHDIYYFCGFRASQKICECCDCKKMSRSSFEVIQSDRAIHKTPYLKVQKKDALFCLL